MESSNTAMRDQPPSTTLITEQTPAENGAPESSLNGVLRLRGAHTERRRVTWTEEVVDNEGLGRKKTKICCIYNKPREFGESSSEESDTSSSDGDDDDDNGATHQPTAEGNPPRNSRPSTKQNKGHSCQNHNGRGQRRKNAYEKTPSRQKPSS
ncbi:Type 1 phosphatases regulator ypi1 [Orbilia javanica]|uniref:Type 1 phosphatases regulator n=1 Tax=Orbilia javanica TaxID=47235 RepID=A0AAN8N3E5_9PEZI